MWTYPLYSNIEYVNINSDSNECSGTYTQWDGENNEFNSINEFSSILLMLHRQHAVLGQ